MVGTRASCQPIPVFRAEAPAPSIARASVTTSSQVEPLGTRSISEMRKIRIALGPIAARTRATVSTAARIRFS